MHGAAANAMGRAHERLSSSCATRIASQSGARACSSPKSVPVGSSAGKQTAGRRTPGDDSIDSVSLDSSSTVRLGGDGSARFVTRTLAFGDASSRAARFRIHLRTVKTQARSRWS